MWANIKSWLSIFCCFCLIQPVLCQETPQINLKYNNIPDSATLAAMINASLKYMDSESTVAAPVFEQTLEAAIKAGRTTETGKAFGNMGLYYSIHGEYAKSKFYCLQAISFFNRCTDNKDLLLIKTYNNLEGDYISTCVYDTAALYCYEAIKLYEKSTRGIKEQNAVGNTYINLSLIWIRLGQNDLALQYLDQAEAIANVTKKDELLLNALAGKGAAYLEKNQLDQAQIYLERAMALVKHTKYGVIEQAVSYNLGAMYLKKDMPEKATSYFQNNFNKVVAVSAAYNLGDAYYRLHQYEKGLSVLLPALKYADSIGMKQEMADAHHTLAKIYEAQGKYKLALEHEQIYIKLKDTETNDQKRQAINLLEMQSKTNQKDKEITEKKLLLSRKDNQLKEKNMWIGGISAGALLLFVSLVGIYRTNKQKQSLQKEKMQRMEQTQQIIELKAMIKGEERERTRIARELHDGIGSLLTATILDCNALSNEHKELAGSDTFNEVMHLLDEMGGEIRKTANNLMPEILLRYNLSEAIQIFCDQVQKGKGVQVSLLAIGTFDFTDHEFTLSIYRIVQELIQNVVKHSKASHAIVQLMQHEGILTVTVEDDGIGFEQESHHMGMGIRNMQARVYSMNGVMNIDSVPGKGTTVYIEFDLQTEKKTETA